MVFFIERDEQREIQLRKKYGIIDKYSDGKLENYIILENTDTHKIREKHLDKMAWELVYNCICLECGRLMEYVNSHDSTLLTKYERYCKHCNIKIVIGIKHQSKNELNEFIRKINKVNEERKDNNAANRRCNICMTIFGRIDPSLSYNENIDNKVVLTKCRVCGTEIILDKKLYQPILSKFYVDKNNIYRFNEYTMDYDDEPVLSLTGLDLKEAYKKYKKH